MQSSTALATPRSSLPFQDALVDRRGPSRKGHGLFSTPIPRES
jgi:hypothetical protein